MDGSYEVFIEAGTPPDRDDAGGATPAAPRELGAGEILLTSMDRDGTMEGYDLALLQTCLRGRGRAGHRLRRRGRAGHFVEAVQRGRRRRGFRG